MNELDATDVADAARMIGEAEAMVVGAGAGMGVDSGLPDFRGNEGFWNAYPPFRHLGLSFIDMANPRWFADDPALAWGFYGHRLELYRATEPHDGFTLLRRWAEQMRHGAFVFTSNVDGQFQKAGFDDARVVECHGSIHHLQELDGRGGIWRAPDDTVVVDEQTMRASEPLPRAPSGSVARPNILMFGDWGWMSDRTDQQESAFADWLRSLDQARLVVVECGAGTAIPSVRYQSERLMSAYGAGLVRINPREPEIPFVDDEGPGAVGLAAGAIDALRAIDELL